MPRKQYCASAWQGETYEEMAETSRYSLNYLKQDVGPKVWRLLSKVLGEKVGKANFRLVIERRWHSATDTVQPMRDTVATLGRQREHQRRSPSAVPDESAFADIKIEPLTAAPDSVGEKTNPIDWGEAPDVTAFYGRTVELATLEKWIVQDRCRLVAITGMGGIGKTALSVKLAQQTQADFEYVVWQSLRHGPPLKETLTKLLKFLSGQEKYLPEAVDEGVVRLIDVLREHRCLLVLDNLETILRSGTLAGQYREGYEGYGELLQRIGETPHQSCLVIATLEKPEAIASHAGEMLPVRTLQLEGLQVAEAGEIFRAKGLSDQDKWPKLVELYRGNPLELKSLRRQFKNSSVAEWLNFFNDSR